MASESSEGEILAKAHKLEQCFARTHKTLAVVRTTRRNGATMPIFTRLLIKYLEAREDRIVRSLDVLIESLTRPNTNPDHPGRRHLHSVDTPQDVGEA